MTFEEYKDAVNSYEINLERSMLSCKNDYDMGELDDIKRMCDIISEKTIPVSTAIFEPTQEKMLAPYFLESVEQLDNKRINNFYLDKTRITKISRNKQFKTGDAEIEYLCSSTIGNKFKINITSLDLTMSDQMGYAHEMGHIPHIEKPRDDFLEYYDTLSIFMEYLVALRRTKDPKLAFDYFLRERLLPEQKEAKSIVEIYKEILNSKGIARRYYTHQLQKNYKYLESLEFAIQLIDIMGEDKAPVIEEIEKVLDGYSLESTADNLGIETYGCKRLQQEYQRIGR